jgi:hypothetical protein
MPARHAYVGSNETTMTQSAVDHHTKETGMTTNLKLKLVGLATTIALFALPIAEASAHNSW